MSAVHYARSRSTMPGPSSILTTAFCTIGSRERASQRLVGRLLRPIARNAGDDLRLGFLRADPGGNPHPFARLQILVMLEKMRDLPRRDLGQVPRRLDGSIKS